MAGHRGTYVDLSVWLDHSAAALRVCQVHNHHYLSFVPLAVSLDTTTGDVPSQVLSLPKIRNP